MIPSHHQQQAGSELGVVAADSHVTGCDHEDVLVDSHVTSCDFEDMVANSHVTSCARRAGCSNEGNELVDHTQDGRSRP